MKSKEEHIEEHLNRKDRTFNFHGNVTYIEKQEITVNSGATFYNGPKDGASVKVSNQNNDIVEELLPFFYGNREKAIEFISSIKGQKPIVVSNLVKQLVKEKSISELSAGKPLHSVLQKYGLYNATLNNWNKRIK